MKLRTKRSNQKCYYKTRHDDQCWFLRTRLPSNEVLEFAPFDVLNCRWYILWMNCISNYKWRFRKLYTYWMHKCLSMVNSCPSKLSRIVPHHPQGKIKKLNNPKLHCPSKRSQEYQRPQKHDWLSLFLFLLHIFYLYCYLTD